MFDWSAGRYETTAEMLEPVSEHVVALSGVGDGDSLLDIACGTGNAALIAARRGATATGLDSAERLVQVAQDRATTAGLDATFVSGDAQDLPFEDGSFDVAVSVFGVIFAPDAEQAIAEALRVVRPGGSVLISHWVPRGTMDEVVGIGMRAFVEATGMQRPKRFEFNDDEALGAAAERLGATLELVEGDLVTSAASAEAYADDMRTNHPIQIATAPALARAGTYDDVGEKVLDVLRRGNEATDGTFRITSPYRVAVFRKA